MGRHSAPVAFDAPPSPNEFDGAHPITDPLLLPVTSTAGYQPTTRPAADAPTPLPSAPRPPAPGTGHAANRVVTQHRQTMQPRAVAPVLLPLPVAAVGRPAAPAFTDGPVTITPRLRATDLTTAPIPMRRTSGPSTAPLALDQGVDDIPRSLGRRRSAMLTACAIALLGGVSAAAAILPSGHAAAAAEGRCVDTSAQPRPAARAIQSPSRSKAWRLAHRGGGAAAVAGGFALLTGTGTAAAANRTPSTTATPSASPTGSGTPAGTPGSTPSTSAPAADTPAPTEGIASGPESALATALNGINASIGALGAGTFTFSNFGVSNIVGYNLRGLGLNGAGIDKTIIEMVPHTSTQAGSVPTSQGTTNNLSLLQATGSPHLSNFTLRGTEQGHLYNGLRIGQATDARVSNVKVTAVPGNNHMPPGETFGINDWRTTGSVYTGVEVDGGGVGAAGFGANNTTDITIRDSYFHNNPYSIGATFWQTNGITLQDVTSTNNRGGLNFERVSGTVDIVRPVLGNNTDSDLSFGSDQASAKVTIVDPKIVGGSKLRIRIYGSYNGPNKQQRSDIRVIVGGVDRTAQLVQWI